MSDEHYVDLLWRIIVGEGVIICALVTVVWTHIVDDRKSRQDLEYCKRALGLLEHKRK